MKAKRVANQDERLFVTAMVTDDSFLAKIATKWDGHLFKTRWANLVAGWCVDYHAAYATAPRQDIENIFRTWADKRDDEDTHVKSVDRFLVRLSDDYETQRPNNTDALVDKAAVYFNRVKLQQLGERIEGHLDVGDVGSALDSVTEYRKIDIGLGAAVDVLHDGEAVKDAFSDDIEPLVKYPGPLGRFFGSHLQRDGFISFLAPEKRGKTFWLLDIAWRAMLQRRKVAFFEVGDMSQSQIMRRIMVRAAGVPLHPTEVQIPTRISTGENGVEVLYAKKRYKNGLNTGRALRACQQIIKRKIRSKDSYYRLSCHANSTLTVSGMNGILDDWANDGWVPDVVVVDYADILATTGDDYRNGINDVWKQLRAMSQTRHCLVVTATQADAASYTARTLSRSNFSEDKRKYAHVTGMVGINKTDQEDAQQLSRLNWIMLREGNSDTLKSVTVAHCLDLGQPAVKSFVHNRET